MSPVQQSYQNLYKSLNDLREHLHLAGRIDDSNAKLDEVSKVLAVCIAAQNNWIKSSDFLDLVNTSKFDKRATEILSESFQQCVRHEMFQNSDGTSIFGPSPSLNIQENDNEFALLLARSIYTSFSLALGHAEKNNQIYLPKIGWVRFRNSRELFGKIKNTTVYREGDHWYASIQVEYSIPKPQHPSLSMIALDMGVKRFFTQSDGSYQNPIDRIVKIADRIAYLQRGLARKIKGSANWRKQQKRIAKLHRRISNIRKDTLHKLSTELSKNHAVIVVEDLQIGNMTVRAKGKNVKAKSGLNRAILSQGWGLFLAMLDYKLRWQGGHLLRVNPAYTSQTCPVCDHVSRENRPSQVQFCCQQCNYSGHADQVAAINVLARGHRAIVCGEWVQLGLSVKQKPVKSENGQPYKQLTLTATH